MKKVFNFLVLLLSIILIGAMLYLIDFEYENIPTLIEIMGIPALLLILVITIIEFLLKVVRFNLTLENKIEFKKLVWPYFRGTYLSYLVPFRLLGEGVRAPIFKKENNLSYGQSLASISIERLTDMLLITLVVFYTISYINSLVSGLLLLSFFMFIIVMRSNWPIKFMKKLPSNKLFDFGINYLETLNKMLNHPEKMFKVSIITLVCWFLAFLRVWLILIFLNENISFFNVISATSIAYLTSLISFLPGGLIGFEGGGIAVLLLMGVSQQIAVFSIFLERIYSFWLFLIVGIIMEIKNKL